MYVGVLLRSTKFAVMVPGPLMVAEVVAEFGLFIVMDPVDVHEEKEKPDAGVAEIWIVPSLIQIFWPEGLVVPAPAGLAEKDTLYWVA